MTDRELRTLDGAADFLESVHRATYAALLRQLLAAYRQTHQPYEWQDIQTFDGRAVYVLVQDGEEVYRAAYQSDGWWCDEGYRVHPTHWMPYGAGAKQGME